MREAVSGVHFRFNRPPRKKTVFRRADGTASIKPRRLFAPNETLHSLKSWNATLWLKQHEGMSRGESAHSIQEGIDVVFTFFSFITFIHSSLFLVAILD